MIKRLLLYSNQPIEILSLNNLLFSVVKYSQLNIFLNSVIILLFDDVIETLDIIKNIISQLK